MRSLNEFAACEGRLDRQSLRWGLLRSKRAVPKQPGRCPLYGFVSKYNPSGVRQQLQQLQAKVGLEVFTNRNMQRKPWFCHSSFEAEVQLRPGAVAIAAELRKQAVCHSDMRGMPRKC